LFLKKNITFYFSHFEYLLLYTWSIYTFFLSYLYFFVICFYLFLYTFLLKNYYTKTKEMTFHYSKCNIISFFYCIKNSLEILHIFINAYDLLLYFIIYKHRFFDSRLYLLLDFKKYVNNIYILIILHKKKIV
jgi:hypothetical protein